MADISKITTPDGTTYDIKDEQARGALNNLGDLAYKDSASGAFTPVGSVAVAQGGTTSSFATNVEAAAPGTTAPSNPVTYYDVQNETLSLYQIGYGTANAKTGDASYNFTGTEGAVTVS